MLFELQQYLAEISGLPGVSLQPAAGAHGELTALMVAAAHFRELGETRTIVLTPDSAHGTNPASASMAGFETVTIPSAANGFVDLAALRAKLDERVAVFMITNPNTLGLFDAQVAEIAELVHAHGGLIYLDGANMNAILGITRPGDFGADMMHYNPHKTFSGPHGGGGPGAGPICVAEKLAPYLPSPVVAQDGQRYLPGLRSAAVDRPGAVVLRQCRRPAARLLLHPHARPRRPAASLRKAVLNANYLLSRVKHFLPVPHGDRCMHEFVASAENLKQDKGLKQPAMDLGKRLLDYGFHAPTVYFPLTVHDALMIEPTETESKETLDAFAEALFHVSGESAELLHEAPHTTVISRPDEVAAARQPILKWTPRRVTGLPHSTMNTARLILDEPAAGPWNMAVDEALLQSRRRHRATHAADLRLVRTHLVAGIFPALPGAGEPRGQPPLCRRAAGHRRRRIVHDHESPTA